MVIEARQLAVLIAHSVRGQGLGDTCSRVATVLLICTNLNPQSPQESVTKQPAGRWRAVEKLVLTDQPRWVPSFCARRPCPSYPCRRSHLRPFVTQWVGSSMSHVSRQVSASSTSCWYPGESGTLIQTCGGLGPLYNARLLTPVSSTVLTRVCLRQHRPSAGLQFSNATLQLVT